MTITMSCGCLCIDGFWVRCSWHESGGVSTTATGQLHESKEGKDTK